MGITGALAVPDTTETTRIAANASELMRGLGVILTEKRFRAERGKRTDTYQGFHVVVEMENDRKFLRIELDNLNRWRSQKEYADYLRWAADEIEKLKVDA